MKKTHDYVHNYSGYWSNGGRCRIGFYREDGRAPLMICSQPPDNSNTSVTNMIEYLVTEVLEDLRLTTPPVWVNTSRRTAPALASGRWFTSPRGPCGRHPWAASRGAR